MQNRFQDLAVNLFKIFTFAGCYVIFALLFGTAIPYVVTLTRTAVIVFLSFFFAYIMLTRIYSGMDIGTRKSRSIVYSFLMVLLISDLFAHLMLCVMDYTVVHESRFVYEKPWLLLLAYLLQLLFVGLTATVGNLLFFRVYKPKKTVIITGTDPEAQQETDRFVEKVRAMKKHYRVLDVVSVGACPLSELFNRIDKGDAVFIYGLDNSIRTTLINHCYSANKDIFYSMEISDIVASAGTMTPIEDTPIIASPYRYKTYTERFLKRAGDIVGSALALLILSPVFGITALAIKLEDKGEIFYRQERITIGGKKFSVLKFRSMKPDVGEIHVSASKGDSRITKVGRVIRKYRIDELPQMINVLRGEMSLVGPRPEMTENVEKYTDELPEFAYRERMKAGLTGMAQVYGKYNTTPKDKLAFDLFYMQHFSLTLDIKILFRTVMVLFTPEESTEGFEETPGQNGSDKSEE